MMDIESLDTILERSRLLMKESLQSLKKVPWKKASRATTSKCGCYLIYSPAGDLLYVGATKNLGARLSAHLSGGLVLSIARERGISVNDRFHFCRCGAAIACGLGNQKDPNQVKAISAIAVEIKTTYLVAFIPINTKWPHTPTHLESMVQAILKPKYGMSLNLSDRS